MNDVSATSLPIFNEGMATMCRDRGLGLVAVGALCLSAPCLGDR